jgi:hypothetical protein
VQKCVKRDREEGSERGKGQRAEGRRQMAKGKGQRAESRGR